MDFKDKVAIVTGSSSGIGAVTAAFFIKQGAKVVIVGRNEEKLKNTTKVLEDLKAIKPLVIKADLTKEDDVKKVIDEAVKKFGQIDILVNNAGAGTVASLSDGIEPLDRMIATNLRSTYMMSHYATPHLIKTKGNIINISSIAAIRAAPAFLPYCVAKAGLDMFTKCIAKELAAHGIRVNSVNPGPVATDFQANAGLDEEQSKQLIDSRVARSPLGYITTSEDVANLILFLASDKARSITGSVYLIENGDMLC